MTILPSTALVSPLVAAVWCLAQAGEPAAARPEVPIALQYLPLLAIAAAAYLLLFRPERERMKKQQQLLGALKKNDRVVTSSGIYGTVANVEVDDASNVKIVVTLSSVARVLRDGDTGGGAGDGGGGS